MADNVEFGFAGWLWLITLGIGCATVLAFAKIGLLYLWRFL